MSNSKAEKNSTACIEDKNVKSLCEYTAFAGDASADDDESGNEYADECERSEEENDYEPCEREEGNCEDDAGDKAENQDGEEMENHFEEGEPEELEEHVGEAEEEEFENCFEDHDEDIGDRSEERDAALREEREQDEIVGEVAGKEKRHKQRTNDEQCEDKENISNISNGKSKGKGKSNTSIESGERVRGEEESDSDVGVSKGEAWRLRVAKGQRKGEFAKAAKAKEDVESKSEEDKRHGRVKTWKIEKCFGFISRPSGSDLFFHISNVRTLAISDRAWRFHAAHPESLVGCNVKFKAHNMGGKESAKYVNIIDEKWLSQLEQWEEPPWWEKGAGKAASSKRKAPVGEDDAGVPKPKNVRTEDEPTSVPEWINAQERLFGQLSRLPENWIRMRSRSSGKLYFYNHKTGTSQFTEPA